MGRTLKERHVNQKLERLREKTLRIDQQIIAENRSAKVLVEAMDDEDLNKVAAIVKKLSTVKAPELPKLTAAIEQAEAEINKYTGGGLLTKAWTKMKDLVGIDNPVVKVSVFADALEKGFSQIPQILKNNGVDLKDVDLNKSLTQLLGHKGYKEKNPSEETKKQRPGYKTDKELGDTKFTSQNEAAGDANVNVKIKNIVNQLQKALAPSGLFGAFKKVPYINGAELAAELVQAPLRVFSNVAKKINAGAKASEIAPDLKAQIGGAGGAETKATSPSEPTKKTSQTDPSAPGKQAIGGTDTSATGETTPKPQGGGKLPPNYAKARQKLGVLINQLKGKQDSMGELARRLVDAGLNPDKL